MPDSTWIGGAYDRCLNCEYLGVDCDGPNTLAMTLEIWAEWCGRLRKIRDLTLQEVADQAEVSIKTVSSIMSGHPPKDIKRYTAAAITRVLVGSAGQWPCPLALLEDMPDDVKRLDDQQREIAELKSTLAGIHDSYTAEIEKIRSEAQRKIDFLTKEIGRKNQLILQQGEQLGKLMSRLLDQ